MTLSLIELALSRALKAYAGKVDKGGQPYILHPLRLMAKMDCQTSQCVALLHDVIEDSEVTAEDLRAEGFNDEIVSAVVRLTHVRGEPYMDYVERVCQSALTRRIKKADIEDNLQILRLKSFTESDQRRIAKYYSAWMRLDQADKECGTASP